MTLPRLTRSDRAELSEHVRHENTLSTFLKTSAPKTETVLKLLCIEAERERPRARMLSKLKRRIADECFAGFLKEHFTDKGVVFS